MNRRSFLSAVALSVGTGASGCVGNGRVVKELQDTVLIPPGRGETTEITEVDGDGAISYTILADKRFDVYYFTNRDQYEDYRRYHNNQKVEDPATGHPELTQAAVHNEETDEYEVEVPEDGGRKSISVDDTHYLVVDYSNYGMGVPVAEHSDPLQATIRLTVIDKQFAL